MIGRSLWPGRPYAIVRYACFILTLATMALACRATPIVWTDDPKAALEEATRRGRDLLITASVPGCASCERLNQVTWPAPSVRRAARGLVALRLNLSDLGPEVVAWQKRLHIEATPTTAVWDVREGMLLAPPLVGFASPGRMAQFIVSAKKAP